ncbi:MAG: Clp protease, partial [Actinomycetota bacterium]|nr:Clp protease [Actinomycetota bacterium]
GIDLTAVRARVEAVFGAGALNRSSGRARCRRPVSGHIPFTRRAKKSLELGLRAAERLHHPYGGDGHLLLGMLDGGGGLAIQLIVGAGIDLTRLQGELEAQIPKDMTA